MKILAEKKNYIFITINACFFQFIACLFYINEDLLTPISEVLRIIEGQITYQDYSSHNGPLLALLFYFFTYAFELFNAYLLLSILINVSFALVSYKILLLINCNNNISFCGGLLAGIWFLPMMGGAYYDHLSYLFGFLSFYLVFRIKETHIKYLIIGTLMGLSFWTKPSLGFIVSLFVGISIILLNELNFDLFKKILFLIIGGLLSIFVVIFLIYLISDLNSFIKCFVVDDINYARKNLNFYNGFYYLLIPWDLNFLKLIINKSKGGLLFYATFVLFIYFSYFIFIKNFFNLYNFKRKIFVCFFFFLFSSIFCAAYTGRNYTNTIYAVVLILPIISMIIFKKKIHKLLFTILITFIFYLVAFLHFSYPYFTQENYANMKHKLDFNFLSNSRNFYTDLSDIYTLKDSIKNIDEKIAMYDDNLRPLSILLRKASWNKNLSQIEFLNQPSITNLNLISDFESKDLTPYYKYIQDSEALNNINNWQNKEIEHLDNNQVNIIISSLNKSNRRFRVNYHYPPNFINLEILKKYIDRKFYLYKKVQNYEIYKRK